MSEEPYQRRLIGTLLATTLSGTFAYVVLDQIGAALVCARCVFVSLMLAKNL
jgi:hypothetical protein